MLNLISQFATPLMIAVAGIAVFVGQYLNGKSKLDAQQSTVSSEVIAAYEVQVKQLKEKQAEDREAGILAVESLRKEIHLLTLKIGEQNGVMGEQKKVIDEYKEIFQNRNPELITVLKEIKDFMKKLNTKVESIDMRSEKREKRDAAVDQGHVTAIINEIKDK